MTINAIITARVQALLTGGSARVVQLKKVGFTLVAGDQHGI